MVACLAFLYKGGKMAEKKYYWLKLKDNFFEGDDIKIIKTHRNGEKYIIFWLQLLLKSISQKDPGILQYKEDIPYTPELLSTITDTNIDIVKGALTLFLKLKMIEIKNDGQIWIKGIQELVGSETKWAELKRKRRKELENKENGQTKKLSGHCPIELKQEIDIKKDIEIDKNIYKKESYFNKIWELYPSKVGKKKSFNYYKASVKTEDDWKNINIAINNYKQSERVRKGYIQNGSTWFNNWQDWVEFKEPSKSGKVTDFGIKETTNV